MMENDLQILLAAWMSEDFTEPSADVDRVVKRLSDDREFRLAFVEELAMHGKLKAVQSSDPRWLKIEDALSIQIDGQSSDDGFEDLVMQNVAATRPESPKTPENNVGSGIDRSSLTVALVTGLTIAAGLMLMVAWWFGASSNQTPGSQTTVTQATESSDVDSPGNVAPQSSDSPNLASDETALAQGQITQTQITQTQITQTQITQDNQQQREAASATAIAVLSQSIDARWGGTKQPSEGDVLSVGDLILEEGSIQIDFLAGVRMLVKAPADLQLSKSNEVLLRKGSASCFVTKIGHGFRIVTSDMEVVDLGTAFSIEAGNNRQSEVHVLEGAVEIKSTGKATLELKERQAVRMGDSGPELVEYSPDRFLQSSDLRDDRLSRADRRYEAWKQYSRQISRDPDVLLHYTFEETDLAAMEVTNHAETESGATDGVVIGCRRGPGRWPSKPAVVYRNAGDRVLLQVPGAYDQLTMIAWARIDALTQATTSILMTERPDRRSQFAPANDHSILMASDRLRQSKVKTVRWELSQTGNHVAFSVGHRSEQAGLWNYDSLAIDHPFTRSDRWGDWACLAVTCDVASRKVIHYLDGNVIGEGEFEHAEPLLLDFMELGNFGASSTELELSGGFAERRFYGAFDEVVIAKRVMSPEEISEFWSVGRP